MGPKGQNGCERESVVLVVLPLLLVAMPGVCSFDLVPNPNVLTGPPNRSRSPGASQAHTLVLLDLENIAKESNLRIQEA